MQAFDLQRINWTASPSRGAQLDRERRQTAISLLGEMRPVAELIDELCGTADNTSTFRKFIAAEFGGSDKTSFKLLYDSFRPIVEQDEMPNREIDPFSEKFNNKIVAILDDDATFARKLTPEESFESASLFIEFASPHPDLKRNRHASIRITRIESRTVEIHVSPVKGPVVTSRTGFERNGGMKRMLNTLFAIDALPKLAPPVLSLDRIRLLFPSLYSWDPQRHICGNEKTSTRTESSVVPYFIAAKLLSVLSWNMRLHVVGAVAQANAIFTACLVANDVRFHFHPTKMNGDMVRPCTAELRVKLHPSNGKCWCGGIHQQRFQNCAQPTDVIDTHVSISVLCCGRPAAPDDSGKYRCTQHYNDCVASTVNEGQTVICVCNMSVKVACIHERRRTLVEAATPKQWKPFELVAAEDKDSWTMAQMHIEPTDRERLHLGNLLYTAVVVHNALVMSVAESTVFNPPPESKFRKAIDDIQSFRRDLSRTMWACMPCDPLESSTEVDHPDQFEPTQQNCEQSHVEDQYVIEKLRDDQMWVIVTDSNLAKIRSHGKKGRPRVKKGSVTSKASILSKAIARSGNMREFAPTGKVRSKPSHLPMRYRRLVPCCDANKKPRIFGSI